MIFTQYTIMQMKIKTCKHVNMYILGHGCHKNIATTQIETEHDDSDVGKTQITGKCSDLQ